MADIGFDSTAIAWVIAKNKERSDSFSNQMKKYRKGVKDGNTGTDPGKLEEDFDIPVTDDTDLDFDVDDDNSGIGIGDFIADLNDGVNLECEVNGEQYTLNLSLDYSLRSYDTNGTLRELGGLVSECYKSNGELYFREYGGWHCVSWTYRKVMMDFLVNVKISPNDGAVYFTWKEIADYNEFPINPPKYATQNVYANIRTWDGVERYPNYYGYTPSMYDILKGAKRITSFKHTTE